MFKYEISYILPGIPGMQHIVISATSWQVAKAEFEATHPGIRVNSYRQIF